MDQPTNTRHDPLSNKSPTGISTHNIDQHVSTHTLKLSSAGSGCSNSTNLFTSLQSPYIDSLDPLSSIAHSYNDQQDRIPSIDDGFMGNIFNLPKTSTCNDSCDNQSYDAEKWFTSLNIIHPSIVFPEIPRYSLPTAWAALSVLAPRALFSVLKTHEHRWLLMSFLCIIALSIVYSVALLFLSTSNSVNDSVQALLCAITWVCVVVVYIPLSTPHDVSLDQSPSLCMLGTEQQPQVDNDDENSDGDDTTDLPPQPLLNTTRPPNINPAQQSPMTKQILWQNDRKIVVFLFFCLTFLLFVFIISAVEYLHNFTHSHTSLSSPRNGDTHHVFGYPSRYQTLNTTESIRDYIATHSSLYHNLSNPSLTTHKEEHGNHVQNYLSSLGNSHRFELHLLDFLRFVNATDTWYQSTMDHHHHHHDSHALLPSASDGPSTHDITPPHLSDSIALKLPPIPSRLSPIQTEMVVESLKESYTPPLPPNQQHQHQHHHHLIPTNTNDMAIHISLIIIALITCVVHLILLLRILPLATHIINPHDLLHWVHQRISLNPSDNANTIGSAPTTPHNVSDVMASGIDDRLFRENVIDFFHPSTHHKPTTMSQRLSERWLPLRSISLDQVSVLSGVFYIASFTFLRSLSILITHSILLIWSYWFTSYPIPPLTTPQISMSSISLFSKPLIITTDVLIKCYMLYILLIPLQSLVYILMRATPKPLITPFARVNEILYTIHHDNLRDDDTRKRLCIKYFNGGDDHTTQTKEPPMRYIDPLFSIHSISHAHCWQASLHFIFASITINLEPSQHINIYDHHGIVIDSLDHSTLSQSPHFQYYVVMSQYKIYCFAKQLLSSITMDNSVQLVVCK